LLQEELPVEQHARFTGNIDDESLRMQHMIERLLNLAMIEQRQQLEEPVDISLSSLAGELLQSQAGRLHSRTLVAVNQIPTDCIVHGECFLLRQALANLLENAIDFTPDGGEIKFTAHRSGSFIEIVVANQGEQIPAYALPRLTERFYSLPRPASGRKSTGLGLNFVQEVAHLHGGSLQVSNTTEGVAARLLLPAV
jgi:two-component system sensor histidine kinase CreC